MAGRDHGELLTRFEEIFGSQVEHEVIKLILQSCEWDVSTASDTLLGMIDKNRLPPHVLSALNYGSQEQDPATTLSSPNHHPPSSDPDLPTAPQAGSGDAVLVDYITETMSTTPSSTSDNVVITAPPSASALHDDSLSAVLQAGVVDTSGPNSPFRTPSVRGEESETSSPSFSPLRPSRSVTSNDYSKLKAAEWILAPEFVPNAFNRKVLNVDVNQSVWPQGMSSRLVASVPVSNSAFANQDVKGIHGVKQEVIEKILQGTKLMVVMRGLPGSGKTTLAKEVKGPKGIVLSTDDFFCDKHGKYVYDLSKISEAHQWNTHRAIQRLKEGRTPIIIDNTNLQVWEMKPYIKLALQYGYDVKILEPDTPWKTNSKELARKNIHGVPAKKIEEMKHRYEKEVKLESVIANLQGLSITQQTQKVNNATKNSKGNDLENNFTGKEKKTQRSHEEVKSFTNPNTKPIVNINANYDLDSSLQTEDYSYSDEDVIIEGYDENIPSPFSIDTNESRGVEALESISVYGSEIKEELIDKQENLLSNPIEADYSLLNDISSVTEDCTTNSFIDLTLALRTTASKDDQLYNLEKVENIDNSESESNATCTNEIQATNDAFDETQIQTLLDQAYESIDLRKSEEEWDSLTSQIVGEDFNEEKFNDMVTSFGSALKKQINNKDSVCATETKNCNATPNTINEDLAMYDFFTSLENKTGQPLSALITKISKNDDSVDESYSKNVVESNFRDNVNVFHNDNSQVADFEEEKQVSYLNSVKDNNLQKQNNVTTPHKRNEDYEQKKKQNFGCEEATTTTTTTEIFIPDLDKPVSLDKTCTQPDPDSLISWECVDINSENSSASWDSETVNSEFDKNARMPRLCRAQRNRVPGDPSKWLKKDDSENEDTNDPVASWIPVEGKAPEWNQPEASNPSPAKCEATSTTSYVHDSQSHTGAISKLRKYKRTNNSLPSNSDTSDKHDVRNRDGKNTVTYEAKAKFVSAETQTLAIDFQAMELDHDLYELKVLYANSNYIPMTSVDFTLNEKGPLTKGELKLDKGTMTDNVYESSVVTSFQNLVAFFPNIPKEDLRDVFEKCKHNSDWAMNVLLDGGYEMSDPTNTTNDDVEVDIDVDTDSATEATSVEDKSVDSSDAYDMCSILPDEKTRKVKQSQNPDDLAKKIEIEKSFELSESVNDHVLRLTGKQYNDLNMAKIKNNKTQNQHKKRNTSPSNVENRETAEEETEGAQYITLVMDPLFASQLNMLFGPVGDCEISGDLTFEDRSVVLPLEICEMIHKYWARTVDGKFNHEAEILDNLLRQDEILARKLQEEENTAFDLSEETNVENDGLSEDQPACFQEIMHIEQALQESLNSKTSEDTSISSQLSLQRLYREYSHVDPAALKEEFIKNGCKYKTTIERLNRLYGKELSTPKTVIAPEALIRYEQELVERVQQQSLEEEQEALAQQNPEIVPDDPQVYRDEAQAHYHQRQEAFQKAQEAYRQGMKTAAAYYAHMGNLHSERLREANHRASNKILEAKNAHRKDANCLDLHLLHVPEAIRATQAFLSERKRVLFAQGIKQMVVSLITGRGVHSVGGQAVLKPCIKEHLYKNGYTFFEANSGMLKVILKSK